MCSQSARGLFRATGNTTRPENDRPRETDDFYPTPPEPTRALLHAERDRLADFPVIWEPACGDGAMVREIEAAGHECIGSDLVRRCKDECNLVRDFFRFRESVAPAIITNPPYDQINERDGKGRWVWHAMERLGVEYMALLLSWSWPGAGGHARLWRTWPPARVYLMRWKIDFTGGGAPPMLNGWFVWDRAHQGETLLRMLDRGSNPSQRTYFSEEAAE